jgi:hypothetical protein
MAVVVVWPRNVIEATSPACVPVVEIKRPIIDFGVTLGSDIVGYCVPIVITRGVTATVVVADLVGSATLVAVTAICVPEATLTGTERTPAAVIVPADADHVTAVFAAFTVAVQVEVCP